MKNYLAFIQPDPLVILVPGSVLKLGINLYRVFDIQRDAAGPYFSIRAMPGSMTIGQDWRQLGQFELTWGYDSAGNKLKHGDRIRHPDGREKVLSLGPKVLGVHHPWPINGSNLCWEEIVRDGWVLSSVLRFRDLAVDSCFRFTNNDAKRRKLSAESWYNYEEGKHWSVSESIYGLDSEVKLL